MTLLPPLSVLQAIGRPKGGTTYLTITFDKASHSALHGTGTSVSWTHANTGDLLVAGAFGSDTETTAVSATYGASAMGFWGRVRTPGDRWLYLFGLDSAPAGTHAITVTFPASQTHMQGVATSYKTAASLGTAAHATATGGGGSATLTLSATVTVKGSWLVCIAKTRTGTPTAGAATAKRAGASGLSIGDGARGFSAGSGSLVWSVLHGAGVVVPVVPKAA